MKILIALFFLLFYNSSNAISEQQFIDKVIKFIEQDKNIEASRIDVKIKGIELEHSTKNYSNWKVDLKLGLGYSYKDNNRSNYRYNDNSSSIPAYAYTNKDIDYKKSVSLTATKRFLDNPSNLSINLSSNMPVTELEKYKQYNYYSDYDTHDFEQYLNISWKYPLLKRDSNAESLKTYHRDILDLERQKLIFYESKEDLLVARLKDYLKWVEYKYKTKIYKKYLQRLQNLTIQGKQEGLILKSAIYKANNSIVSNANKLKSTKESLAILLSDNSLLKEEVFIDASKSPSLIEQLDEYLKKNSRDLKKIFIEKSLKQIDIAFYDNKNLPKLDFVLAVNKTVADVKTQTTAYNNDSISYNVELLFEYPLWGKVSNQSKLEISLLNLEKIERSYAYKLQYLHAKLEALNTTLKADKILLNKHLALIDIAEQNSNIDSINFKDNKIVLKDVIAAFSDETVARINYITALIDYCERILDYDNLLDRIII